jgi:hypothetical protein
LHGRGSNVSLLQSLFGEGHSRFLHVKYCLLLGLGTRMSGVMVIWRQQSTASTCVTLILQQGTAATSVNSAPRKSASVNCSTLPSLESRWDEDTRTSSDSITINGLTAFALPAAESKHPCMRAPGRSSAAAATISAVVLVLFATNAAAALGASPSPDIQRFVAR